MSGNACAKHAPLRKTPLAKNQHIVEKYIDKNGNNRYPHGRLGVAKSFEKLLESKKKQLWHKAQNQRDKVWRGQFDHLGHLPHEGHEQQSDEQNRADRHRRNERQQKCILEQTGASGALATHKRLPNQRRESQQNADRKYIADSKHRRRKRHRRQLDRAEMSHHKRIDQLHNANAQLRKNDGQRHFQIALVKRQISSEKLTNHTRSKTDCKGTKLVRKCESVKVYQVCKVHKVESPNAACPFFVTVNK